MEFVKRLSLLFVACSMLGAQTLPEDPVMKARSQRALAQGVSEADLIPVPRSVAEPPPLPPAEDHVKDTKGGRLALARAKVKGKRGDRHGRHAVEAAAGAEPPVKVGKRGKAARSGPEDAASPVRGGKRLAKGAKHNGGASAKRPASGTQVAKHAPKGRKKVKA